jgi:hypothetical protein
VNWTIAVPVFGDSYWQQFCNVSLPRMLAALEGHEVRWLIHTDRPNEVAKLQQNATIRNLEIRKIASRDYDGFIKAHRDAYAKAADGDVIVFLCADLIPSRNLFDFALQKVREGYLAVSIASTRTNPAVPPRIGASAAELLDFAYENQHPITRESFYGWGRTTHSTNVYFTRDGVSVVLRALHLHPVVVVKQGDVDFNGTIDADLLAGYPREKIHVVQNGEAALIEISPPTKTLGVGRRPFGVRDIFGIYAEKSNDLHRWYFEKPIRIAGTDDCGDAFVASQVRKMWEAREAGHIGI